MPNHATNNRFNQTLTILASVVSVVALFISLQANQIAKEANSPRVAVLSMEFLRGNSGKGNNGVYIYCDHRMRMTNLGGRNDSIIGYGVELSLLDETISAEGSNVVLHAYQGLGEEQIELQTNLFSLQGAPSDPLMIYVDPGQAIDLTLPYKIGAGETTDIYGSLFMDFSEVEGVFRQLNQDASLVFPSSLRTRQNFNQDQSKNHEYIPVSVIYQFNFASGRIIRTTKEPCVYIEQTRK